MNRRHGHESTYAAGCRCRPCRTARNVGRRRRAGEPTHNPGIDEDWLIRDFPVYLFDRSLPDDIVIRALEKAESQ